MGTLLKTIIERKIVEAEQLKKSRIAFVEPDYKTRSLIKRIKDSNTIAIISEFKRASPTKGEINMALDPVNQAKHYAEAGAAAISVLTDGEGFKGSFADLEKVRQAVDIPILCKDFIIDEIQIDQARESGADVILLIAAALKKERLEELHRYASDRGLECLVEIHDEGELEKALFIDAQLIGVNNRNLNNFQVNIKQTEKLGPLVKNAGALLISESGMRTREDVLRASAAGADGILVGETFMISPDVRKSFAEFQVPIGVRL